MSQNTIDALRDHLFDTIKALKDKDKPMDIDRANAIKGVASVIVDTAKAEVDLVRVTGGIGSGFIPIKAVGTLPTSGDDGKPQVRVHRLR